MSIINLQTAKQYLNVIHDFDDDNLQMLLDAAESEAQEFLDQPLVNLLPEAED
nr:phage gp6-like head-tail connector protein [Vibrio anguillarum]